MNTLRNDDLNQRQKIGRRCMTSQKLLTANAQKH